MPAHRPTWLGSLVVLGAAALFGSLGVLSRTAYGAGMAPFAFVTWRTAIGAVGLWLLIALVRRPGGIRSTFGALDRAGRRWLALAVALAVGVNAATFLAFNVTTVALALLGFYTYPAMVAAGAALLGRERLDLTRVAALALSLTGMAAVVLGGPSTAAAGQATAVGLGLALAGALFQTGFVLTSRGYAALAADQAMATILAGGALICVLISLLVEGPAALAFPLGEPSLLALLVFAGLFTAALSSVMFLMGIRWIGSVRTGILMLFEPVVGVTLAAVFLAEGLAPFQLLGAATILLAALLVQRSGGGSRRGALEPVAVEPIPGGP